MPSYGSCLTSCNFHLVAAPCNSSPAPPSRRLLLRDNPVGVVAARKLLKAVKAGQLAEVDLLGCSFGVLGASSTVAWDPHDPDGVYDLDLEVPAHYQVGKGAGETCVLT